MVIEKIKSNDSTFDIMKGICILLVIVGHMVSDNKIIYSFHMPLFFIVGGYFTKDMLYTYSEFRSYTKKNIKRLLLPYFVTMLGLTLLGLFLAYMKGNLNLFISPLLSTLWMSGDELYTNYGVVYVNALWFLVALFWTRELFYMLLMFFKLHNFVINDKSILIICAILVFIVCQIKMNFCLPPLPLCFLQGVNALLFYSIGWYVRRNSLPKSIIILVLFWPLAVLFGHIDMLGCYYEFFPIDILGACGGTYLMYLLSKYLSRVEHSNINLFKYLIKLLRWCGVNSLLILCVHDFDLRSSLFYSLKCRVPYLDELTLNEGRLVIIHLFIALLCSFIITRMPVCNKIFSK